MDILAILYALVVLHAGYLNQLSFRQPSSKVISTRTESQLGWIAGSPIFLVFGRIVTLTIALHQAVVALSLARTFPNSNEVLHAVCPTPEYIDAQLFTWTKTVIAALVLLCLGSYIRLQAYALLGTNFTFRIAKPDQLITSGLYAYVRHPSYTGLFTVLLAMYLLFFRQRGLVSCWMPLIDEKMITDPKYAYLVPVVALGCPILLFMRRVRDEEKMMEREFGDKWREYKARTKKFVPYIY